MIHIIFADSNCITINMTDESFSKKVKENYRNALVCHTNYFIISSLNWHLLYNADTGIIPSVSISETFYIHNTL